MGDEILRTKFRRPPTPPDIVPLFEESVKGSLEPGKLAALVMLDRNPLKVEPAAIKDIKVMETIKAGKPVFTLGIPR
jgi:hypothetical protein